METMIKCKFHSIVDVITNSSTVIFTYQNSVSASKELVAEILKMSGSSLSPDDVFYYGTFLDEDEYDGCPDDSPGVEDTIVSVMPNSSNSA